MGPEGLDRSEDELFEQLGRDLLGDGRGLSASDRSRHRDFGRSWFGRWLEENKDLLCLDPRVVALIADPDSFGAAEELAVVTDLLAGMAAKPPVAMVALIVVKRGLTRICST
jgi:hypothetical protein